MLVVSVIGLVVQHRAASGQVPPKKGELAAEEKLRDPVVLKIKLDPRER